MHDFWPEHMGFLLGSRYASCSAGQSCSDCAGTNSYVLFTLDKLICKLVKQFQTLLADDLAQVTLSSDPLLQGDCSKSSR